MSAGQSVKDWSRQRNDALARLFDLERERGQLKRRIAQLTDLMAGARVGLQLADDEAAARAAGSQGDEDGQSDE